VIPPGMYYARTTPESEFRDIACLCFLVVTGNASRLASSCPSSDRCCRRDISSDTPQLQVAHYTGPRARHTPHRHSTMSGGTGYHNRGIVFAAKISNLLRSLDWATCREISPKVEYWIDYALTEQSVNADDLVDQLSPMMWENRSSDSHVVRFLKEFHDAPHRSEQARSFVDSFCSRVLRSFAAASAEDLGRSYRSDIFKIAACGGEGFVRAASLVGHLIECGLLNRKLVGRHLIKPLIAHQYTGRDYQHKSFRARAIYQLLVVAGRTLLQGLLEPEDVRVCFETLNSEIPSGGVVGLDADALSVTCGACSNASP